MKDYQHASQLFIGDGGHGQGTYKYAPKHAFMYHLFFDFSGGSGDQTIGMLVKQCTLPKLTFDTKTLNSYNRPYIVQTKVHFDPINVTFHDDNSDSVRSFLYDYFKYYYADPDGGDWGYRGKFRPFLSSIRIYSLSLGKFSEYILLNPVIKNYSNGEHNASDGAGIMQHQMTVDYENVIFNKGRTSASSVKGFASLSYDHSTSPFGPPPSYPGSSSRTFGSNPSDYTMYSPGLYGGCYNNSYKNPLAEAAAAAFNVVDAVQSGINAFDQFSHGNYVGGLFSAANGLDAVSRLSTGFSAPLSYTESTSLNRNLTSGINPFSPVQIPSVGGFMTSMGGAAYGVSSMMNTTNNLGTRVNAMTGIGQPSPSGGIGQLPSEVSAYMHSTTGYGASEYAGATNIQPSMPSDLTSSSRSALNSNSGYGDTDVRQVNDGFTTTNSDNQYI